MVRVPFWLQLLLSVLILKQSDAAAYRRGELQEEIESLEEDMTNTRELKHNNGEQADNCCACRSLLEAARSVDVDRAKGLAMCDSSDSSDNCTDVSSFRVTPQTDGPLVVHVDIASNNSRLRDQPAEVKASGNSPVTKAPAVMPNYYDQIAKEFEEQNLNKFSDKMAKKFRNQTTEDDLWRKVLEDHIRSDSDIWRRIMEDKSARDMRRRVPEDKTTTDEGRRKLLEDQAASDNVRRKVLEDQTASEDGRRKILEDQAASELWRKMLGDVEKLKVNENLPKMFEGNKTLASIMH